MIVKKHISHEGKLILAICDEDILGKKFEEGEKQLDLTSKFYQGEKMSEQEILEILPDAHSANIVGRQSIDFAIKHRIVLAGNIFKVQKIPFAICIFDQQI
jgi:hypothetical protein